MIKKYLITLIFLGNVIHHLNADKAYVTNINGASVSIFNTAKNMVTGTVTDLLSPTFNLPDYAVFSPNGQIAYVSNLGVNPNTISVINGTTDEVTQSITIGTFTATRSIAITPDATTLYAVGASPDNAVARIDLTTNTYIANVDDTFSTFADPRFIVITPDGTKAYVTNVNDKTVKRINIASNEVDLSIATGLNAPDVIIIGPDGTNLYVSDVLGTLIAVINTTTNTVTHTISAPSINRPYDLIFSLDGTKLYVLNADFAPVDPSGITVFDLKTNSVVATIAGSGSNLSDFFAFTSNGNTLYLANQGVHSVSIINPMTNTITGTVSDPNNTFKGPYSIAMVPALAATPSSASGSQINNIFLTQTELVNVLNWTASSGSPVSYAIYRDIDLTDLAGTTSANVLAFIDHDRSFATTYTYYIVAMDQNGAVSKPVVVTVNPV